MTTRVVGVHSNTYSFKVENFAEIKIDQLCFSAAFLFSPLQLSVTSVHSFSPVREETQSLCLSWLLALNKYLLN